MTDDKKTAEAREKFYELIDDIQVAMVTTTETDGSLRARPMAVQRLSGEADHVFLLTRLESHKVDEIAANPQINLGFAKGGDYVSLSGTAEITREPDLVDRLWTEADRGWFPEGRDDPHLCVLKVALDYGEYWDPPSAGVTLAYGWAKAMLTGRNADGDLGDNAKIGRVA